MFSSKWPSQQASELRDLGVLGRELDMVHVNKYVLAVTKLKFKFRPTQMAESLRHTGQALSKLEKYSLVSGLSMNFFFGFIY